MSVRQHSPGRLAARPPAGGPAMTLQGFFGVFRYSRQAVRLVWETSRKLTAWLGVLTLVAGVLPAAVAYVGARIVDAVVAAIQAGGTETTLVIELVVLEGFLVAGLAAAQRGLSLC